MTNPPILWATPKWPLPVTDGARVATRALLHPLLADGTEVDLLALVGSEERCNVDELRDELGPIGQVHIMERQSFGKGAWRQIRNITRMVTRPKLPVTVSRYAEEHLQNRFSELIRNYSTIVFDGLHGAALSSKGGMFAKPEGKRIIYRAHNVETMIWQRAAENANTAVERKALLRQRRLMALFETSVIQQSELTATVSAEDIKEFQDLAGKANYIHIPIGLQFGEEDYPPPTSLNLLYVGRLDWPPNRDGLNWFLGKVWPRIQRTDIKLMIAGSGDDSWLKPYRALGQIEFLGCVPDIEAYYKSCAAAIVPVFYGSGTRLKVIEPARFKKCCIATKMAVEGSPLTEDAYFKAESVNDWVSTLEKLSLEALEVCGKAAHGEVKAQHEEQAVAHRFRRALEAE